MALPFIVGGAIAAYRAYKVAKAANQAYKAYKAAKKAKQVADAVSTSKKAAEAAQKAANAASKTKKGAKQGCPKGKKTRAKAVPNKTYARPSGFRKGVKDKVWQNAKGRDGKVRDPVTGKVMSKNKSWDMGHKPGHEFRKHQQSAANRKISREQFLKEHNDPKNYRPELPSSNRSHKGEIKTDTYFGK